MAQVLKVRRSEPELVKPAKATPNEVKSLSDWDDRALLRIWLSFILFYKPATTPGAKDPVDTIKKALAEALVYYYPWAGRLKEQGPDKRLVVDCSAEGVEFVTADADISLHQLGEIRPPFSNLVYHTPADCTATLGCPIFAMQVTRLACGGFVLGFSFNHVMSDIAGIIQFVTAVSELARGAPALSVPPVWQRKLLNARGAFVKQSLPMFPDIGGDDMTYQSFFFGAKELEAIRAYLPKHYFTTSFELISACVFHCRVISLEHEPEDLVHAAFTVNARSKFVNPPLPSGYYGNASFLASIVRPMKSFHDLRYVVEEVKKVKDAVNEDYIRSSIEEEEVTKPHSGVLPPAVRSTYILNDVSRLGLSCLDFGWGKPIYAGNVDDVKAVHFINYIVSATNSEGEEGKLITLCMPKDAMEKFELSLCTLLGSI